MIIEQAQILTTHNLALLFGPLGLGEILRRDLRNMSERCFRWICRRQAGGRSNYRRLGRPFASTGR